MLHEEKIARLRAGTRNDPARSAAVELLIGAGLVRDHQPWVVVDESAGTCAIDFDRATEAVDALTDEHRRWDLTPSSLSVLEVAASIADGLSLHLRHVLPDLDDEHTVLVMTAIAEAAGHPETPTAHD